MIFISISDAKEIRTKDIGAEYTSKIEERYKLNPPKEYPDPLCFNQYIETEDSIGEVVQFFIENVYETIVVHNAKDIITDQPPKDCYDITIYNDYIE